MLGKAATEVTIPSLSKKKRSRKNELRLVSVKGDGTLQTSTFDGANIDIDIEGDGALISPGDNTNISILEGDEQEVVIAGSTYYKGPVTISANSTAVVAGEGIQVSKPKIVKDGDAYQTQYTITALNTGGNQGGGGNEGGGGNQGGGDSLTINAGSNIDVNSGDDNSVTINWNQAGTPLDCESSGNGAECYGDGASAVGDRTTAIGSNTRSTAEGATTLGSGAKASYSNSAAIGAGAEATAADRITIGTADSEVQLPGLTATEASTVSFVGTNADGVLNVIDIAAVGNAEFCTRSGANTVCYGTNSVAQGTGDTAIGAGSLAGTREASTRKARQDGELLTGSGANGATAVGALTEATGDGASSFGAQADAQGRGSIAIGYGANSLGENTMSIGSLADADGQNSIAIGADATASGQNSIAIGAGSSATRDNQLVLGDV